MGEGSNSDSEYKVQYGNTSNTQDFRNLFGGGGVFNLGAGSSNTSVISTNTDLSSMFRDESTNTKKQEASGGGLGFDVAASVGVGVGGTGSAGSVDKTTTNSEVDNSSISANRGNSDSISYIKYFAIGGGILALMLLLFKLFKKKKRG